MPVYIPYGIKIPITKTIIPVNIGYLMSSLSVGYMPSYLVYSLILVIFSFIKGFYDNYYSIHFSEKLRISFITGITVIFFQMIYHSIYNIDISIIIFISWILIPFLILIFRYILNRMNISKNNITISIVGKFYQFSDLEIKILIDKKFKVYFYDELNQYLEKIDTKSDSENLVVINMNSTVNQNNELLSSRNTISLGEFMTLKK